ncbi:MAG: cation-translocating P-type ATPase [Chloroflexi bacterium]|nr:MAG: cation-translocating P-type ATPase [Chloroflexota bacterium]
MTESTQIATEERDLVHDRAWHALEQRAVAEELQTSITSGLDGDLAARRLISHGPNELAVAPKPRFWKNLLAQFSNFLVIILILAAGISAILGEYIQAAAIMAIVLLNAALGVIQERRAEEAMAALQKLAAPEAQVVRGGQRHTVPGREIVVGDLVLLEAGNYVPADMRLIESANLRIEEAALTGESVAVDKHAGGVLGRSTHLGERHNMAHSGTMVSYGRGRGLVVASGMDTQIGQIAEMLRSVETEATPLQRKLDQLGKVLGGATLAISAGIFLLGWARGYEPLEIFLVAVSLAVAAVPEGLPAVVTVTLALGMREMIRRNALVRRLSSVETLGSTTVICSDKTGTLTQNVMTATRLWVDGTMFEIHVGAEDSGNGAAPAEGIFRVNGSQVDLVDYPASTTALWVAVLDNDAEFEAADDGSYRVVGDPTEVALVVAANHAGARRKELERAYPRIGEIPFDSNRKRMTTVHKVLVPKPEDASPFYDGSMLEWEVAATKGAPDVVLNLCTYYQTIEDKTKPMDQATRRRVLDANETMARGALRVIAVAYRVEKEVPDEATPEMVEKDLIFVGLIGMIDPARPEVRSALERARAAGVRTIMITGDYPDTARAIAEEIGLMQEGHQVLTGQAIEGMDAGQLMQEAKRTDVFARVTPEHKVRIVNALKAADEVVAMTGDGVNDAPALKRADIGVAMGLTGTDVAKETADMVLTDDNYASIVAAIDQGRVIYANIRKFVFYLLSCNGAEILTILIPIMAGLPSPLTAIQLLWLNLVTDGAPALALGLEKGEPDIMDRPPRPVHEAIINREMWFRIGIQTIAIGAVSLAAYFIGLRFFPELAKTMTFATIAFSQLLQAFAYRADRYPLLKIGIFSNRAMLYAVATSAVLLFAVIYVPGLQPIFDTVPLGTTQWTIILPLLLVPALVAELTKAYLSRGYNLRTSTP